MKLKLISDTHFGVGRLTQNIRGSGWWLITLEGSELIRELKDADVLVLLGDVFEGSTAHPYESMDASQPFFDALREHTNVNVIIWVEGNHDNFIKQKVMRDLSLDNTPRRAVDHYIPCRIDKEMITLPNINGGYIDMADGIHSMFFTFWHGDDFQYKPGRKSPHIKWLSDLTKFDIHKHGKAIPWVVCSDLIINDKILVLHGHQFDPAWGGVAYDLLYVLTGRKEFADVAEFYEYLNIPLTISGGALGNAGRATAHIREFQEAWNGIGLPEKAYHFKSQATVNEYLNRVVEFMDSKTDGNIIEETVESMAFGKIVDWILGNQKKAARGDEDFWHGDKMYRALTRYAVMAGLKGSFGLDGGKAGYTYITGHTHHPDILTDHESLGVDLYNTGGYLGDSQAQVVVVDTETNEVSTEGIK